MGGGIGSLRPGFGCWELNLHYQTTLFYASVSAVFLFFMAFVTETGTGLKGLHWGAN